MQDHGFRAKIVPKSLGVATAQSFSPTSETVSEPAAAVSSAFFTGIVLSSLAAACIAFGVTLHGLSVPPTTSKAPTMDATVQVTQELFSKATQVVVPDVSANSKASAVEVAKAISATTSFATVAVAAVQTQTAKTNKGKEGSPIAKQMGTANKVLQQSDRMRRLAMQWRKEDTLLRNLEAERQAKREAEKRRLLLQESQKRTMSRPVRGQMASDDRAAMRMLLMTQR